MCNRHLPYLGNSVSFEYSSQAWGISYFISKERILGFAEEQYGIVQESTEIKQKKSVTKEHTLYYSIYTKCPQKVNL